MTRPFRIGPPRIALTPLRCQNSAALAGFPGVDLLARRVERRQQDPVQHRVRVRATAVEDTHDGRGALGVHVVKVGLHRRPRAVDGVLGWGVEVVLHRRIALTADLQGVVDVVRDRYLDHVPGVLDRELGRLVPPQQRSAAVGATWLVLMSTGDCRMS